MTAKATWNENDMLDREDCKADNDRTEEKNADHDQVRAWEHASLYVGRQSTLMVPPRSRQDMFLQDERHVDY